MAGTHTATFVFTDLVGSTSLTSSVSPPEGDALRRLHFEVLRSVIEATGGHEVKNLGDGLMVSFSSASRALACAVGMQQAVERHNRRHKVRWGLRVGAAVGEATEEDGDFFGDPVVEAARLCSLAGAGQILATETVISLLGRHAVQDFRAMGALELKGLPEPVVSVEVLWEAAPDRPQVPVPRRLLAAAADATLGFVGRSSEVEGLEQDLKEAVSTGQLRLALLGGEPGIGKTALAAQVARRAAEGGTTVTFGNCEEGLGVAFQPWLTAVGHLVEHAGMELAARLRPTHVASLRRLLPHLNDRLPEGEELNADPSTERFMLLETLAAVLAAASEPDGLLVVLDDLQWADAASLQVVAHLLRAETAAGALVVGTFRPGDLSAGHPLDGLAADLRRERRARRYDIGGLRDADVVGLVESAAGQGLDRSGTELAHTVWRETGGNPFFVVELLRHLAESGAMVKDDSGQYSLKGHASALVLPEGVREVVRRRLERLGADTVRALTMASVIGQEFELDVLAAVTKADEDHLLDLLDRAEAAALVNELDDPPGRYRFAHALIQTTLYGEVSPARRQRAHLAVAGHLEERDRPGDASALAHHLLSALQPADVDKAVGYARRAGDEALAALAPVDAAGWYDKALGALGRSSPHDSRLEKELLVAHAEAQSLAGDPGFRDSVRQVTAVLSPGEEDLLVRAALIRVPGSINSVLATEPAQLELLESALGAVGPSDTKARALVLAAMAEEYSQEHPEAAATLATEAWELAERLGDPDTILGVYTQVAPSLRLADRRTQRQGMDRRIEALLPETTNLSNRFFALNHLFEGAVDELDWPLIYRLVDEIQQRAEAIGLDVHRWEAVMTQAWICLARGKLADAERLARDALEVGRRADIGPALATYGAQIMMHRLYTGNIEEVVADRDIVEPPLRSLAITWRLAIVWLQCQGGYLDKAAEMFSTGEISLASLPRDMMWLSSLAQLGDCACYLEQPEVAAECYSLLLPYAESFWFSGSHDIGYMARYLGRMASATGRVQEAQDHLRFSLMIHREKDLPYWEARSALDLAEVLKGTRADEAAMLEARARDLARHYGFGGAPFSTLG